ncbi:hypothetical protein VKT23_014424 [Stygiomarasmius scandens]|uniref:Uncharacterized protein n=1 Tax=Marasmiellus scandens TaxID=2682957 RepID=A0ABR1J3D4_9AGAR
MATQSVSSSGSLPSYRSKADPPPSYCSSVSSASRPNQSSVSSPSTSMFTHSSEPSLSSSSSSSSTSSQSTISPKNYRHHSHYHSHGDTHNHYYADGSPRPPHRTDETAPLLPHSRKRHIQSCSPIIILATVAGSAIMALFFLLIRAVSSSRPPPMSAWANVTSSKLCHSTGVREYTATLVNAAKGWDPVYICNRTPIIIHGVRIQNPVSCTVKDTPAGRVVQGTWLAQYNERDCYPAWSIIRSGDCVSSGARSYYAHLDYVPPGLGSLESCEETPAIIHGQSLFSDRCELVPESGSHNGSSVARGEWIVDFEENACIPTWQPIIADQCVSYATRSYHADLTVPHGLEEIALSLCSRIPASIGSRNVFPTRCEALHNTWETVIRGHWDIDEENECIPTWRPVVADQCVSFATRSYHADLVIPPGLEEEALSLCTRIPTSVRSRSVYPTHCEALDDSHGPIIRGHWDIDEEDDCIPTWRPVVADKCISYATRSYHADLAIPLGLEEEALSLCSQIPTSIHWRSVYPTSCEELDGSQGIAVRGRWDVDFSEPECIPEWTDISSDSQCHAYNAKKFTAILSDIPEELDPLHTCRQAPLEFFGVEQKPMSCEWDEQDRVVGSWFVGVPECRPILKNIINYGCIESEDGYKRIEGEVVDIGKNEDWYRLCTTVPYHSGGKTYLPIQCESRTSWAVTRRYALYNIASSGCRK